MICFVLGQLFSCAMQQADMRIGALYHFTIQFQHQPQHAMRRGMLRAEIHGVILISAMFQPLDKLPTLTPERDLRFIRYPRNSLHGSRAACSARGSILTG